MTRHSVRTRPETPSPEGAHCDQRSVRPSAAQPDARLGLPIQLISGYKGTAPIRLAVESDELGACFNWVSMRSAWQHALETGEMIVALQLAA
jgi:hypothetical protein